MITMAQGGGGEETRRLINEVFAAAFANDTGEDAFSFAISGKRLAFTTDSYVVSPLIFPGGDIGRLAVCGTVNDLLTSGAAPKFLSTAFILEEGLRLETLRCIVNSMKEAASEAGVKIVTGDTKVTERVPGREPSLYINTAGIGTIGGEAITSKGMGAGDKLIVTGAMGNHHACILSARMGLTNGIRSDAAPLTGVINALLESGARVTALRDITRGGLAGVLNEFDTGMEINEAAIPADGAVLGLCGILGLDPLYMGNEGKMLIAVAEQDAERALKIVKKQKYCADAALIGEVTGGPRRVVLNTAYGRRLLPPMSGQGLPRIC